MKRQRVNQAIHQFGCTVEIEVVGSGAKKETTKAFIQPIRSISKAEAGQSFLNLGSYDDTTYLYIGPAEIRIDTYPFNTIVRTNECAYTIKRAQAVCFQDEILYIWGVLQKYVEESTK